MADSLILTLTGQVDSSQTDAYFRQLREDASKPVKVKVVTESSRQAETTRLSGAYDTERNAANNVYPKFIKDIYELRKALESLTPAFAKTQAELKVTEQTVRGSATAWEKQMAALTAAKFGVQEFDSEAAKQTFILKRQQEALLAAAEAQAATTKEYKEATAAIANQKAELAKLNAEAKKSGGSSGGGGTSRIAGEWHVANQAATAFRATLQGLQTHLGIYTSSTIVVAAASYKLMEALRDTISTGKDYTTAISKAGAVMEASGVSMERLEAHVESMAKSSYVGATEMAKGLVELGQAGLTASQALQAIGPVLQLGLIGTMDFSRAAEIATATMHAFNLEATELTRVVDVFAVASASSNVTVAYIGKTMSYAAPVAEAYGLALEDVTAAIALLGNAGIVGSRAGTTLRRTIESLYSPTEKGAKALAALGVTTHDAFGGVKSLEQVFNELSDATGGATTGLDKLRAIVGLYALPGFLRMTSAAKGMVDETGKAVGGFEQFRKAIDDAAGAAKVMSERMMANLGGDLKRLSAVLESLQLDVFKRAEGPLRKFVETLSQSVKIFSSTDGAVESLVESFKELVKIIGVLIGVGALYGLYNVLGLVAKAFLGVNSAMALFMATPFGRAITLATAAFVGYNYVLDDTAALAENVGEAFDKGAKAADAQAAKIRELATVHGTYVGTLKVPAELLVRLTDQYEQQKESLSAMLLEYEGVVSVLGAQSKEAKDMRDAIDSQNASIRQQEAAIARAAKSMGEQREQAEGTKEAIKGSAAELKLLENSMKTSDLFSMDTLRGMMEVTKRGWQDVMALVKASWADFMKYLDELDKKKKESIAANRARASNGVETLSAGSGSAAALGLPGTTVNFSEQAAHDMVLTRAQMSKVVGEYTEDSLREVRRTNKDLFDMVNLMVQSKGTFSIRGLDYSFDEETKTLRIFRKETDALAEATRNLGAATKGSAEEQRKAHVQMDKTVEAAMLSVSVSEAGVDSTDKQIASVQKLLSLQEALAGDVAKRLEHQKKILEIQSKADLSEDEKIAQINAERVAIEGIVKGREKEFEKVDEIARQGRDLNKELIDLTARRTEEEAKGYKVAQEGLLADVKRKDALREYADTLEEMNVMLEKQKEFGLDSSSLETAKTALLALGAEFGKGQMRVGDFTSMMSMHNEVLQKAQAEYKKVEEAEKSYVEIMEKSRKLLNEPSQKGPTGNINESLKKEEDKLRELRDAYKELHDARKAAGGVVGEEERRKEKQIEVQQKVVEGLKNEIKLYEELVTTYGSASAAAQIYFDREKAKIDLLKEKGIITADLYAQRLREIASAANIIAQSNEMSKTLATWADEMLYLDRIGADWLNRFKDAVVDFASGAKGAFKSFFEYVKRSIIDLAAKQIMIGIGGFFNPATPFASTGATGAAGATATAGGAVSAAGGVGSTLGGLGSLMSSGFGTGISSTIGAWSAGGFGAGLANAGSFLSAGTLSGIMTGIGAVMPYIGAAIAAITIAKKIFGKKPKVPDLGFLASVSDDPTRFEDRLFSGTPFSNVGLSSGSSKVDAKDFEGIFKAFKELDSAISKTVGTESTAKIKQAFSEMGPVWTDTINLKGKSEEEISKFAGSFAKDYYTTLAEAGAKTGDFFSKVFLREMEGVAEGPFEEVMQSITEKVAAIAEAFKVLDDYVNSDIIRDYNAEIEKTNRSISETGRVLKDDIREVMREFDGSLEDLQEIARLTAERYAYEMKVLAFLRDSVREIADTAANLKEQMLLDVLEDEEKYKYYKKLAEQSYAKMIEATDPEEIRKYALAAMEYAGQTWGILPDELKKALRPGFDQFVDSLVTDSGLKMDEFEAAFLTDSERLRGEIGTLISNTNTNHTAVQIRLGEIHQALLDLNRKTDQEIENAQRREDTRAAQEGLHTDIDYRTASATEDAAASLRVMAYNSMAGAFSAG